MRLACPLRRLPFKPNGGSPKGRGWIRLAEAESVKLRISRVCLFYIQILTITAIHPAALPRAVWPKRKALLWAG